VTLLAGDEAVKRPTEQKVDSVEWERDCSALIRDRLLGLRDRIVLCAFEGWEQR